MEVCNQPTEGLFPSPDLVFAWFRSRGNTSPRVALPSRPHRRGRFLCHLSIFINNLAAMFYVISQPSGERGAFYVNSQRWGYPVAFGTVLRHLSPQVRRFPFYVISRPRGVLRHLSATAFGLRRCSFYVTSRPADPCAF